MPWVFRSMGNYMIDCMCKGVDFTMLLYVGRAVCFYGLSCCILACASHGDSYMHRVWLYGYGW